MSQDVMVPGGKLPAHLAEKAKERAETLNKEALVGAGGGEAVNRISLKAGRFRLIQGGEEVGQIKEPEMNVVILRTGEGIAKTYYANAYTPGQEPEAPDCWSEDGIRPDPSITQPQCDNCTDCPMNVFGSKINEVTGKESKACTDIKRLAVVPAGKMDFEPHQLNIPAASLKDFGRYVRQLAQLDPPIPYNMVVTETAFDTDSDFPKLLFKAVRYLSEEEYAAAEELHESSGVEKCIGKGSFNMQAQAAQEAEGHQKAEQKEQRTKGSNEQDVSKKTSGSGKKAATGGGKKAKGVTQKKAEPAKDTGFGTTETPTGGDAENQNDLPLEGEAAGAGGGAGAVEESDGSPDLNSIFGAGWDDE